jgi:Outer membrane lipoprotein-sorting protein
MMVEPGTPSVGVILIRIALIAAGTLVALSILTSAPAAARPPSATEILRKAEAVRNPELDYAVDFTIHGVSRGATVAEREASYSMVARGKDKTIILMRTPASLYGAFVMMADGAYWMLLPKASKPWELSGAQMQNGDVATGDIARANLLRGYAATLSGDEPLDGVDCWRLTLQSDGVTTHYARIVYWVAKRDSLPEKLELYGRTGALAKTVRYGDFRKGALGVRPMRLEIESLDEWKETSTLDFSNLRRFTHARETFTPAGLLAFRDAAVAARDASGSSGVPLEQILGASSRRRESGASP